MQFVGGGGLQCQKFFAQAGGHRLVVQADASEIRGKAAAGDVDTVKAGAGHDAKEEFGCFGQGVSREVLGLYIREALLFDVLWAGGRQERSKAGWLSEACFEECSRCIE